MTEHYYISSTKYTLQERETKKHGKVYDVVFRVVIPDSREEKQKKLSGFSSKTAAKAGYTDFITKYCELRKGYAIRNAVSQYEMLSREKSFAVLAEEYFASLPAQNKESTIYGKRSMFQNFLLPKFADKKMSFFTKEELYRYQDEIWAMKKPDGTPYSYQHHDHLRKNLSTFLTWCESRYGYKNYMPEVKKPKRRQPKTEMQFWTRDEFDKFISAVDDPKYYAFFSFLFFTGKRKGEVLALNDTDIDLKKQTAKISKTVCRKNIDGASWKITTTKADKIQTVPLCPPIVEILKNYKNGSPFYFGGARPFSENAVSYAFDKAINKSGVKKIRIHDLRHSFASMLIHLGANIYVVADLLGDTVEQITHTYGHLYEEDKSEIISRIK